MIWEYNTQIEPNNFERSMSNPTIQPTQTDYTG